MSDAYDAFLANARPRTLELATNYTLRFGPENARQMIGLRWDMMGYCVMLCGRMPLDEVAATMRRAMANTKRNVFDPRSEDLDEEAAASACDLVLADVLEDIASIADVTTPASRA
jgi:hypothetical protein